jgi:hypothetical protein
MTRDKLRASFFEESPEHGSRCACRHARLVRGDVDFTLRTIVYCGRTSWLTRAPCGARQGWQRAPIALLVRLVTAEIGRVVVIDPRYALTT